MKHVTRLLLALSFLAVFAVSTKAQQPNVAIRLDTKKDCVKVTLKNLRSISINIATVEFFIYDGKTCKRICVNRRSINKKLQACDTMEFEICCPHLPQAAEYIYYVRIRHSQGQNEAWGFEP
jgi:hypothetical protein